MSAPAPGLGATWQRLRAGRSVHAIAATLLPYDEAGAIDWAAFERHVARTRAAGLDVAVNMDTGFGDLLAPAEREAVLDATRRALGPSARFYAGAYALGGGDPVAAWREAVAAIERRGGHAVLVPSPALHGATPAEKTAAYAAAASASERGVLGFELSPRFAPHGEIWDDETFERLLEIPKLLGAKHSSLDRGLELRRLAARDRARPAFRVYTGNDLAIDMVAYGSDYLLGLATFAPERFAERDAALAAGSLAFLTLGDALQHLGNVGFREPVPAYKHAAALFLELTGGLARDAIHPRAPRRPPSDRVLLFDCARRLGMLEDPERTWRERVAPWL
jgi:dihydrodipicolinate synthase/N-acetylneuraminate lyase